MNIKYVFWDSDNTLVNTALHHWNKHFNILQNDYDIVLDEIYKTRVYENNGGQNWEWMSHEIGLNEDKQVYLDKIDHWYSANATEIQLRPGIDFALRNFRDRGIPQAVVSNGRRRSVMAALKAKKLDEYFEFILCKEDYDGRKPDPTPYLTALKKMETIKKTSIDSKNCLVIEDDPLGVHAGNAAGMLTLHRKLHENQSTSSHADFVAYEEEEFKAILTREFLHP